MAQGFGGQGNSRVRKARNLKLMVVGAFVVISSLAIGLPLLAKPAVRTPVKVPKVKPVVVAPLPTPVPMIEIFLPVQRINIGAPLSAAMFKKESVNSVSLGALSNKVIRSEPQIVGRFARMLIMPGRPLTVDQVMDSPDNLITRKIRPGFRAITIPVNNVTGIEGWGLPGTRVDVIWVSAAEAAEQVVTTVVRGAEILSVAGQTEVDPPNKPAQEPEGAKGKKEEEQKGAGPKSNWTVTLLVAPEDGQKIFLASRSGELSLMLRGDLDTGSEMAPQVFTRRGLLAGGGGKKEERVEGVAKSRRDDGSVEEWSVIEGRVWRWDQATAGDTTSLN